MIKIGHFIDSQDPGGAESIVIELCIEQIKSNNDVEVLHFGNKWLEDKCKQNNIKYSIVPFQVLYKSIYTLPLFCIIFSIFLLLKRLDIIHTHLFDTILPTVPAALIARIPHIATLHDVFSIENNKNRHRAINIASKSGSIIVAVSKQILDHINNLGIVDTGRVCLVRNGINLQKYRPNDIYEATVNNGNEKVDMPVIISVGRLVPIKSYDSLLRSFKRVRDKVNNVTLIIVGDGPDMNSLIKLAMQLEINNAVRFLGHRDNIPDLLRHSDIFALSSLSEGLSCSIIEAMASGLPIVATDVGGNNELVINNINGYLVQDGNIDEFKDKLIDLIVDVKKRRRYGKASYRKANNDYSIKSMIQRYNELYISHSRFKK